MTRSSSALWSLLRADGASGSSHRNVQCHGGANERLQRLFINLVALMEIDGTPGVAFEAGVEEARRVLQRGALGEGHLHDILVRLTGADYSGVRPHRNPSPLPLLDHFGVGLLDENSYPSERLAPPITQLLDFRIYQLRGRVSSFSFLRAARRLLHGCCRFLHGCYVEVDFAFCVEPQMKSLKNTVEEPFASPPREARIHGFPLAVALRHFA